MNVNLNEEFIIAEDREFILRLAKNYKIFGIKEPLTKFRRYGKDLRLSNLESNKREYYNFKFLERIFKDYPEDINEKIRRKIEGCMV